MGVVSHDHGGFWVGAGMEVVCIQDKARGGLVVCREMHEHFLR